MSKKPGLGERGSGRAVGPLPDASKHRRLQRAGPFSRSSFIVRIDECQIGLCSVSAPHWGVGYSIDPTLRPTVILRRAVGQDRTLYDWRHQIDSVKDDPRTVTVILLDCPGGTPVNVWDLAIARAVRWSGPELDAFSNAVAFEELEITYEKIIWRDQP